MLAETFRDLQVTVSIEPIPAPLSVSRMTALVLLVNEAALNAANYAFRPGYDGIFAVSLRPHAGGALRLVVHDDGPGPVRASAEPPATLPAGARG
ncbi:ATP-binding protein [Paracraurococcus ruber]|uniref:Histidine kinase/HSP90-like ATPase domain-containing protein n=1 Tax=Paracraurococcus ruber TaxID=77675 RepID=A0ABS1D9B0_9PROT|nr:ATP-binding protein [Paracraurococcus ruber]MBK1662657.1 hypothetical protein [Paracraurococcus ruber]TDG26845.1 sensor histidine kinase [Paracraurococcus ruber]